MPTYGNTTISINHPQDALILPTGNEAGRLTNAVAVFLEKFAGGGCRGSTSVTITDGSVQASGTVTLSNATGAEATGTITYSSATGTTTAIIAGVTFNQTTGNDAARATALAAAVTASTDPAILGVVTASAALGVVTITALVGGTVGNSTTLVVAGTGIARSAATLTGGTNNTVTVTLDGVALATNVTTQATDTTAAAAIAATINASVDPAINNVFTATSSGPVVTITYDAPGTGGNTATLAASGTGATASGSTLTGGVTGTTVTLKR